MKARGVTLDLDEGDMVTDVILIAKIITPDGQPGIAIGNSEGMDWLTQFGVASAGYEYIRNVAWRGND